MKAMILAAGLGTRLCPLTNTTPKPLLPVGGRPILIYNLMLLKRHGITEVIINLHHLSEQIVQAVGDGGRFGMRVAYSHEPVLQGTGGGIKQAEPFLRGGPFLVLNGDTLSACDLTGLLAAHRHAKALATLALRDDPDAARWGPVTLDDQQRILQINGKPTIPSTSTRVEGGPAKGTPPTPTPPCMFAGTHVLEPGIFDAIPAGPGSIIDVYVDVLGKGRLLQGYRMNGYWSDIGTPERYAEAQKDAADGKLESIC